jgi:outer membrane protein TolC
LFPLHGLGKPLTVEEAISQFLKTSFEVRIQRSNEEEAEAQTQSFLGIYDFVLKADVSYSHTPFVSLSPFGADRDAVQWGGGLHKRFPFGVSLSLELDQAYESFGRFLPGIPGVKGYTNALTLTARLPLLNNFFGTSDQIQIGMLKINEGMAKLRTLKAIEDLFRQGSGMYQAWYVARQALEVKQVNLTRAQKLLTLNLKKLKDGLVERGDVAQSKVGVQARTLELEAARKNLNDIEHAFAAFLNIDKESVSAYEIPDLSLYVSPYASLESSEMLSRNITVSLSKAGASLQQLRLNQAEQGRLATLNMVGQAGLKDVGPSYAKSWDQMFFQKPNAAVGLELSLPLGNGEPEGAYRQARVLREKAELERLRAEKQVAEAYQATLSAMSSITRQLEDTRELNTLQREKLAFEERKFGQGRSSIDLILRFQDELSQVELQLDQLLSEYVRNWIEARLLDTSLLRSQGVEPPSIGPPQQPSKSP